MKVEQEAINKETGVYFRNPTRIEITDSAETQQEIVDMMNGAVTFRTEEIQYGNINPKNPPQMAGILEIRTMSDVQLEDFFKTLLRFRGNMTKLHLNLGEYSNKKKISSAKVSSLNTTKKRHNTGIAKILSDIFSERGSNIVELKIIKGLTEGAITKVEVYSVDNEDYNNDELFSPAIGIEYYTLI